jgi:hypothetical protein
MSSKSGGKRSAKQATGGPAGVRTLFVVLGVAAVPAGPALVGDAASVGVGAGAAGKPDGARRLQLVVAPNTTTNAVSASE